jgi:preprotein translocase subunit SecA
MLEKVMNALFGSQHERDLKALLPLLYEVNRKEAWAASLKPADFPRKTEEYRRRIAEGEALDLLLPECFALAREAARRVLDQRAYDTQVLGAIVLHHGKIMEMKTGEGKTLSSVLAAYLNSLPGKGVHIVTVNDYLAERDAAWMGPIYGYLGVSVGAILSQMDNDLRKAAYRSDITYGTNNEFGFDYLRDNMRWDKEGRVQRPHNFCIIDEIDSILIDEARTPLIISGQAEDDTQKFGQVNSLVTMLNECEKDPDTGDYPEEPVGDYKLEEKSRKVSFTDEGMNRIEELLLNAKAIDGSVFADENFEYIHYFTQAVKAHRLYRRDVDYVVQEGQVQIVDEFTGRILHGRRYSDGLHQAIEAKENIRIAKRNRTLATITFQNYFRMYNKLSGMTGTADTEAREFANIYGLDVVVIPTNRPVIRRDEDDIIYYNEKFKFEAICDEIQEVHEKGQPILVGTVSIEKSELLATMLTKRGIKHEVLNAKNHAREALIIAEAGAIGSVTIATNMAGRGTDIKLGGSPEYRAKRRAGTDADDTAYEAALAMETESWRSDYERVRNVGGLYILGTERHESRRIDNQLRGRSGRQGDPGKSRFFLSLDDNLMRLFSGENLKNLMGRIGMQEGEPIFHPWINKSIERAQSRVEERNFEIRKHLLEYDDVLNEQRTFIYSQRDSILSDGRLLNRVLTTVGEIVEEAVETAAQESDSESDFRSRLSERLWDDFFISDDLDIAETPREHLSETVMDYVEGDLNEKESLVGAKNLNEFIKLQYLRSIDAKWQDHLDNLEALREAVYLRAYGQKNPLLEYKLEGFQIFDTLIYEIRTEIAKRIVKMKIERPKEHPVVLRRGISATANHAALGQFDAAPVPAQTAAAGAVRNSAGGAGPAAQSEPQTVQVKRAVPKVGRNDPCPCGSGRKYKHCCGR